MNGPLLVLFAATLCSVGLSALHDRRGASAALAASTCAALSLFVLLAPLDEAFSLFGIGFKIAPNFQLLGRELVLDDLNQASLAFLFFTGTAVFSAGWVVDTARYLFSAGMLILAMLAASLMIQPFLFASIFIMAAALASVLILAEPGSASSAGALRFLPLYAFAMASILVGGWMLESSGVSLGSPELALRVASVLALGFAILLAVPPFHVWLLPAARSVDVYGLAFVAIALHAVGYLLLLRFFNDYEWLRGLPALISTLEIAGGALIVVGGLGVMSEDDLGRVTAYALLVDFGGALLALSLLRPAGYNLGLSMMAARTFSLVLAGLGLSGLHQASGALGRAQVKGAAYSNPIMALALLLGLLSLTGAPMTAGFPGRWATIHLLVSERPVAALLAVGGILAGTLAGARWLTWMLSESEAAPPSLNLTRSRQGVVVAAAMITVGLSLFPQLFQPWILQALTGLANLI